LGTGVVRIIRSFKEERIDSFTEWKGWISIFKCGAKSARLGE
jgi:hypothetical protein